jgi:hypothetical protein
MPLKTHISKSFVELEKHETGSGAENPRWLPPPSLFHSLNDNFALHLYNAKSVEKQQILIQKNGKAL